jgi:hypothetical protein
MLAQRLSMWHSCHIGRSNAHRSRVKRCLLHWRRIQRNGQTALVRLLTGEIAVRRLAFISLMVGTLLGTPAWSQDGTGYKAMVEVTSHQISVNRGKGFQQVDGITPARPGYLVMASESGHGWIIYPDCDVEVLPGKVYTVEDRPGVVAIRDAKELRPICKRGVPPWLIGAALAGAAVGVCAAEDCFDDDDGRPRPASP